MLSMYPEILFLKALLCYIEALLHTTPENSGVSVGYYLSRNVINSTFLNITDKQNALQYHYRS